jgi:ribosomal protein S4E
LSFILVLTKFVLTEKEAHFLINSGLVFINGVCVKNIQSFVNQGDVVQLGLADKFFKFYRVNFHTKSRLFKRISYRL